MNDSIVHTTMALEDFLNDNDYFGMAFNSLKRFFRAFKKIGIAFNDQVEIHIICNNHKKYPVSVYLCVVKGDLHNLKCRYEVNATETSRPGDGLHTSNGMLVIENNRWNSLSEVLSTIENDWPQGFEYISDSTPKDLIHILTAHPNEFIRTIAKLLST